MAKATDGDIDTNEPLSDGQTENIVQTPIIAEQPQAVQGSMIYYGPNLPGGILAQFTVFKGGLPEYILKDYPEARNAFAPVASAAELMSKLNNPHSFENSNISKIRLSFMKGK